MHGDHQREHQHSRADGVAGRRGPAQSEQHERGGADNLAGGETAHQRHSHYLPGVPGIWGAVIEKVLHESCRAAPSAVKGQGQGKGGVRRQPDQQGGQLEYGKLGAE